MTDERGTNDLERKIEDLTKPLPLQLGQGTLFFFDFSI